MSRIYIIFLLLNTVLGSDIKVFSNEKKYTDWDYSSLTLGPAWWDRVDNSKRCIYGNEQSPIEIVDKGYFNNAKLPDLIFKYEAEHINYKRQKFTIVTKFNRSSLQYGNDTYTLKEMWTHIPSEHKIFGVQGDFEVQLIHANENQEILILSVLGKKGKKKNKGLEYYVEYLSDLLKGAESKSYTDITFNPMALVPKNKSYFTYMGSLTTPPCTENIKWILMRNFAEVSFDQLKKWSHFIRLNARPLQSIKNRKIEGHL